MRTSDVFKLSTRMFQTRRMRTLLTILGIGIGIGAILFLVSLGYGLQRALISQITSAESLLSLDVVQGEKPALILDDKILSTMAAFPEVAKVVPLVSLRGQLSYQDTTADVVVNAAPKLFLQLSNIKMAVGDTYSDTQPEILVSNAIVRSLDIGQGQTIIGLEVSLSVLATMVTEGGVERLELAEQPQPFRIVGVIDEDASPIVFVPLAQLTGIAYSSYSQVKVKVKDSDQLEQVRNKIIDMGFVVAALSDVIEQANKIFRILQVILAIFGVVALVVSAIGMFNTMTIALMERTQEVGIMKSLGASRTDIMFMFVTEAIIMGFLGGIAGILIGFLGGESFNFLLNVLATRLGGNPIDIFYTPAWFAITVVVFSTIVGFVTGIWPARRAAHLNPLEAVRYK